MEKEVEKRKCQNCKTSFIVEPEDFNFYEKIKVPPPTFCVDCRIQRRLAWRNTHCFYKRKDSFSDKEIISIYSPDKNLTVIDQKTWWGDSWNALDYGKDYDFLRSFFQQWKEFRDKFPLQSMSNSKAVNSDYCNVAEESRDSYLCSASWKIERTFYSDGISKIKDSMDLHVVHKTEFSYDDVICLGSYKLFYSQDCTDCVDSYFLYDCRNCTSCFMCFNLRNKSYCINNIQYSKEEYLEKMKSIDLGSFNLITEKKKEFKEMKLKAIHKYALILNSYDVTGNNIDHAKNCHNCFDISDKVEDCKNVFWSVTNVKNAYDSGPGVGAIELAYEVFDTGAGASRNLFSSVVYYSNDIEYSFNCYGCNNLFACIGLRNKNYCILNKQYSKEEYFIILEKIKKHMNDMPYVDKKGIIYRYGEFFPAELSPFCYDETVAQDFFPLTKENCLESGFGWKGKIERNYKHTLEAKDLPDNIKDVSDSILNDIIECEHQGQCLDRCTTAFKIIPNELIFYRRFNIPIPRLCYSCRHAERFKQRNPMKLWHRQCMKEGCNNEFETSYSPDRPEIVYCESCYNKEVY
ncbi:MAG: hypothetical protein ACP5NZ_04935 [Nanobdellota archaeon]